jgi:hypothetical protein
MGSSNKILKLCCKLFCEIAVETVDFNRERLKCGWKFSSRVSTASTAFQPSQKISDVEKTWKHDGEIRGLGGAFYSGVEPDSWPKATWHSSNVIIWGDFGVNWDILGWIGAYKWAKIHHVICLVCIHKFYVRNVLKPGWHVSESCAICVLTRNDKHELIFFWHVCFYSTFSGAL